MSANPHANGGLLLHDLDLPDFRDYAVAVRQPATQTHEATRVLGTFLRDVIARNGDRFRLMGPDETASNRLDAVYESTDKVWESEILPVDENLARSGRVMEVLSEHLCQGWLEGYLLTGRHGLFNCYEAFVHIVDSMLNQHAKWLYDQPRTAVAAADRIAELPSELSCLASRSQRRRRIRIPASSTSSPTNALRWLRVYLPPDANTLLSVADHCLRSRDYINVIVAGKQPALSYLDMESAIDALRPRAGDLAVGQHRDSRPRCGVGLRRRCPDPGDVGRRRHPASRTARAGGAGSQRRRPDAPAARFRAPAWVAGQGIRRHIY